ncbi:MAG: quinate 5-dehydrogenase [Ardenticatenaceae bacterium]|nr:quinate 5-dehydrogenase [Ardenticatenaceae bacterium]
MKKVVSISLGSSKRDKKVEIDLLGQRVSLERRGVDGDVAKATALFTELDGKVDVLSVGGIDLWVNLGKRRYRISAAHKLVQGVKQTPIVDGGGLKNTLEKQVAPALIDALGPKLASGRVLLTAAIDRFGMTMSFVDQGYDIVYGDLMFALGLPIPLRSFGTFKVVAGLLAGPATKLPISVLYPTGDKQEEIIPKFGKWYQWANVIAGDCHYIKRHMPDELEGKIIVTNTTTPEDMTLFRQRGVSNILTTTPVLDGRSFGTNVMEAALTAVADKKRPLTHDELTEMLAQLNLTPTLHDLKN